MTSALSLGAVTGAILIGAGQVIHLGVALAFSVMGG